VGQIAEGMHRGGWDLQLTEYGDGHWRATFYVTGQAHSIVGGTAWEPTAWTAVQRAAWEGLGTGSQPRPQLRATAPDLLGRAVEALEELAEVFACGAAGDRGAVTSSRLQTVLGMDESATIRSARSVGPPRADSANELRQSSLGARRGSTATGNKFAVAPPHPDER
jgi:hypothetical protein